MSYPHVQVGKYSQICKDIFLIWTDREEYYLKFEKLLSEISKLLVLTFLVEILMLA